MTFLVQGFYRYTQKVYKSRQLLDCLEHFIFGVSYEFQGNFMIENSQCRKQLGTKVKCFVSKMSVKIFFKNCSERASGVYSSSPGTIFYQKVGYHDPPTIPKSEICFVVMVIDKTNGLIVEMGPG